MSKNPTRNTLNLWMDALATLAAISGVALLVWLNWTRLFPPGPALPEEPVSLAGATLRGDAAAPVVLVEYSDYMCPFCVRFEQEVLPDLQRRYIEQGRVQLALKHHPLERLHPGATRASEAAFCADRQGRFLPMHTALFGEPSGLSDSRLFALATELSLDTREFSQCLSGEASTQVERDIAEAQKLGLTGTPAFLVGRRLTDGSVQVSEVLNGARPLAEFESAVERALGPPGVRGTSSAILVAGGGIGVIAFVWFRHRRNRAVTEV